MTARKPKPRKAAVRKGSKPTLEVRMETAEAFMGAHSEAINQLHQRITALEKIAHPPVYNHVPEICARLDALEARSRFRDASHDEPVSNAGEAIGGFRILGELPAESRWRRFLTFMRSP